MEWKPMIDKWNDEEQYDVKEPLWRRMLKVAMNYGDITELQATLLWLHHKNMQGDSFKMSLIGYHLCNLGVDLEKEMAFSKQESTEMLHFAKQFESLDECAIYMMRKYHISEEIIDEFKSR